MTGETRATLLGAALAAAILLGLVFFGAVESEWGGALAALVMLFSAALLIVLPGDRPRGAWVVVTLALPGWLLFQLVPLPTAVAGLLSPRRVAWIAEMWPGPAQGCAGAPLIGPPPAWQPLTVDPFASREFLFHVVAAALCFLAVRALCRGTGRSVREPALWVVACFATAEAVYGIVQALADSPHVLWVLKTAYTDCASGTLINRNHYAMLLYLGLGATLTLLLNRLDDGVDRDEQRETALRVTLGLFAALQLAAVLASKSRGGVGGALIVLASAWPVLWRAPKRVRFAVVGLALAVIVPVALFVGGDLLHRVSGLGAEWKGATSRGGVLRLSGRYVRDFLLTGSGGGTFEFAFARYRTSAVSGLYDYAHDDYLQALLETGAPGLVLALLPVALFVIDAASWRRRVAAGDSDEDDRSFVVPWPLYAALAVALLHEFVDFGLHIPALAMFFAMLAGLAAPPARDRAARRFALAPAWAGLALALPALAHSAIEWPALGRSLPWPESPLARHTRATELLKTWRTRPEDSAAACSGLQEVVRARRLRPLEARYMLTHARLLMAAADRTGIESAVQDRLRQDARRALEQTRALDPWDPRTREGVMNVALALGDLDKAAEDALAITTVNPEQASNVVRTLLDIGIPATSIQRVMARSPEALGSVLKALLDEGNVNDAGRIVPADIAPDPVSCKVAWLVLPVLDKAHHVSPIPFLEGCIRLPAVQSDAALRANVAAWIAGALIEQKRFDDAAAWVAQAPDGESRTHLEMRLAQHREAWKDVIVLGEKLLRKAETTTDTSALAWLHYSLGVAYAHDDQLGPAREELRAARELDPSLASVDSMLADLEIGKNPVR